MPPDAPPAVFTPPTAAPNNSGAVFAPGYAPAAPPVMPAPPSPTPVAIGAVFMPPLATSLCMVVSGMTGDASFANGTFADVGVVSGKSCYTSNGITIAYNEGVHAYGSIVYENGAWNVYVKDNTGYPLFWAHASSSADSPAGLSYQTEMGSGNVAIAATASLTAPAAIGVPANTPNTPPVPPSPAAASPQSAGAVFAQGFIPATPPAAFSAPSATPSTPPAITP